MKGTKSIEISKHLVWEAYKKVKANGGSPGIDQVTIELFDKNLKDNLYKLWNRMSSGSYFPTVVKLVEISKGGGKGMRPLGIPIVSDRIPAFTPILMATGLQSLHMELLIRHASDAGNMIGYWT
jgi:RNA-directed DNA polymerase